MGKSSDWEFWYWSPDDRHPPGTEYPSYCDIIGACSPTIRNNESIANPCAPELDGVCDGPGAEFR